MSPFLSIILPVYNAEKTIERAINSVIADTDCDIELIVVDDGSTDNSKSIIENLVEKDNRIVYYRKENGGVSSARNCGLNLAQGVYTGFLDSDDAFVEGGIKKIISKAKQEQPDMLIFGFYSESFQGGKLQSTKANAISHELIFDVKNAADKFQYIFESSKILLQTSWNKVFKTDIIHNNNICFDTSIVCYENLSFIFDFLQFGEKIVAMPDILYKYIGDNGNSSVLTKRRSDNLTSNVSRCFSGFVKLCDRYNYSQDYREYMYIQFLNDYTFCSKKIFLNRNSYRKKKQDLISFLNDEWFIYLRNHYFGWFNFYKLLYKCVDFKLYNLAYLIYKNKVK